MIYDNSTKWPEEYSSPGLEGTDLQKADFQDANLQGVNLKKAKLQDADLEGADLRNAKNLTLEQVKVAKNWEKAQYDDKFRQQLGLGSKISK